MELELRRKAKMWKWNGTAACEQSTITVAQRDSLVYKSRPKAIAHITGVDRRFEPPFTHENIVRRCRFGVSRRADPGHTQAHLSVH